MTERIRLDISQAMTSENEALQAEFLAMLPDFRVDNAALLATLHSEAAVYREIKAAAAYLQEQADCLLVLGVGGSQAGSRAVIEALRPKTMDIFYAGNGFSGHYLQGVLDKLAARSVAVVVISKSGNTAETLLTFGIVKKWLTARYGADHAKRIMVVTGHKNDGGSLGTLAAANGYRRVYMPDAVGGRYSVFTAVGLLPLAAAGVDIDRFLEGARYGEELYAEINAENDACRYALARNVLYKQGFSNELWVTYAPYLFDYGTWWRQLFIESESKNGIGLYPVVAEYSNDLHYLGQYLSQGPRNIFETIVWLDQAPSNMPIDEETSELIGWQAAADLVAVSRMVKNQTKAAHLAAGVPQIEIDLPGLDEFYLGCLTVFFVQACLLSGFFLGCDPLDQPGVEAYKSMVNKSLK